MRVRIGTSGYAYQEWKGPFYPADLAASQMLAYYAARLDTVEINNTFYRMPSEKLLRGWAAEVPERFSFVLKASRKITHQKRLRDCADTLEYLTRTAAALGDRLGPLLFQLPPYLRADLERLTDFLDLLPDGTRAAIEFRHESWLDEAVFAALLERRVALVVSDTGKDDDAPLVATAPYAYLRLRRGDYDRAALEAWARRIAEQSWDEVYLFFKHEDEGAAPRLAATMAELLGAAD